MSEIPAEGYQRLEAADVEWKTTSWDDVTWRAKVYADGTIVLLDDDGNPIEEDDSDDTD